VKRVHAGLSRNAPHPRPFSRKREKGDISFVSRKPEKGDLSFVSRKPEKGALTSLSRLRERVG
jgi:hypothetical protein